MCSCSRTESCCCAEVCCGQWFTLLRSRCLARTAASRNRLDYDSTGSLSDALGLNGQTVGCRREIQGRWGGVFVSLGEMHKDQIRRHRQRECCVYDLFFLLLFLFTQGFSAPVW